MLQTVSYKVAELNEDPNSDIPCTKKKKKKITISDFKSHSFNFFFIRIERFQQ